MAQLDAHLHELRHARIDGGEGVVGQQALGQVLRDELGLHVVAAEAERRLGQVVRAEAEEVGNRADFVGRDGSARQLDHRAHGDVKLDALLGGDFGDSVLGDLAQLLELGHHGHERDHDLGLRVQALFLQLGAGSGDGAHLHDRQDGVHDAQAAAAKAQHRVRLAHAVDLLHEHALLGDERLVAARGLELGDLHVERTGALQELVQRRVEQAHDDRQPVHGAEHAQEVARLGGQELAHGLLAHGRILVEDEGLDDLLAVAQEHVLGAAQSDALGAEAAGQLGVLGVVGVGAHAQRAELVGPLEDGVEVARHLGQHELDRAQHHGAGGAVDGDHVAFLDDDVGAHDAGLLLLGVDAQRLHAANARGAHAAGDDGRVRRLAAVRGEDALGGDHAGEVVGVRLPAHEHALAARLGHGHRVGGGEHGLAHGGAGGGVQALGDNVVGGVLVELRVQQLVELLGIDAHDGLLLRDEALLLHLDGDVQRGGGGALAHAGLQHPQLALLDGELDVAHVAEVVLEGDEHLFELAAGLFQTVHVLELGDRRGVADAGHDVLALGVHQVVAVELLLAVGGVARERDARGRGVALVAEHHGLHVDGGAQIVGDLVLLAVQRGARVVPAAEDGLDGQLQLHAGILRELHGTVHDEARIRRCIHVLGEDLLELGHELLQVLGGEIGVGRRAASVLHSRDGVLEQVAVEVHDHVGEHLDEATVGIPGEARVIGLLDQPVDGLIVQAEVEDGVHHARHGHGGAGTHGHEQRILRIADLLAHAGFEILAILLDGAERAFGPRVARIGVLHAGLARDGESGRHGQPDVGHLGEVRALAAEDRLHAGVALSYVVALRVLAERIHSLDFFSHLFLLNPTYRLYLPIHWEP